jgi:DUF4097 and DUF4098 domain-containing protein YvlB
MFTSPRFHAAVVGLTVIASVAGAQQKIDQRIASNASPSVRLEGQIGYIKVTAWKHDSVALTGTLSDRFQLTGGIAADMGGGRVVVEPRTFVKGNVVIKEPITMPVSPKESVFELRVPPDARVWIKTPNGTVIVAGLTGVLDVNIVGGSVQLTGAPRNVSIESMEGAVTIDGSPEWLRVKTADGNITMSGGSADASFTTISGTIRVGDGTFDRAKFESVSGPMTFGGALARGAAIDFISHNGPIELRLPRSGQTIDVDVTATAGTITDSVTFIRPTTDGRGQTLSTWVPLGGVLDAMKVTGKVAAAVVKRPIADARISVQSYKGTVLLKPRG